MKINVSESVTSYFKLLVVFNNYVLHLIFKDILKPMINTHLFKCKF